MLTSLFNNNPDSDFTVYLIHSSLSSGEIKEIASFIGVFGQQFEAITIEAKQFDTSPTHMHYTKEMYYRLLAYQFLPTDLDKVLYLDPDILVINSIKELYNTNIDDYLFAAASHDVLKATEINKIRFFSIEMEAYYNTGVLLMNLVKIRQEINEEDILTFIHKYQHLLILPDQDVINGLYSSRILGIDEKVYNYDARYYTLYKLTSKNLWDMDQVIFNTVILHFCGKKKPWNKSYSGEFHSLYKHYEKQTDELITNHLVGH